MYTQNYESLAAFILTVDKSVLAFLLPLDLLLAVALVALLSRNRRPLELFAMLMTAWVGFFLLTTVLFYVVLGRPFLRFEVVQYPFLMHWVRHIVPL